jgi:hypothetical protein
MSETAPGANEVEESPLVVGKRKALSAAMHRMHADQRIVVDAKLGEALDQAWREYDAALVVSWREEVQALRDEIHTLENQRDDMEVSLEISRENERAAQHNADTLFDERGVLRAALEDCAEVFEAEKDDPVGAFNAQKVRELLNPVEAE